MTQEVQAGSSGTGLSFCADLRVRGRGRAIGFADRRDGGSSSPVSAAFPGADETSAPPQMQACSWIPRRDCPSVQRRSRHPVPRRSSSKS